MSGPDGLIVPMTEAAAQDRADETEDPGLRPPRRRRRGGRSRIRFGDPVDSGGRTDEGRDPAPEDDSPRRRADEPERLLAELAEWPSADARQASIRLAAQPTVALPLLERTMNESRHDWRMIAGAATTLGRIGQLRSIELIESRIQDRRMYQHSGDLIDAIVKIDPVGAKARLLAHLLHPSSAVVGEAAERLAKRVDPSDLDALREVHEIGGVAARTQTLSLMRAADPEAARPDFASALRDRHSSVCFAAATALAADDSDEALELLRSATRSPLDRQMAYAYVGLAQRADRTTELLLEPADLRALLGGRGIDHVERVNRAAAAIALADAGYYHAVPELDDALDARVLPALVDAWTGPEFWPDARTLGPLVVGRLRRLSGNYNLSSAREWQAWWEEQRDTFECRRVLASVPPAVAPDMVLSIGGDDAPGEETTVLSASGLELSAAMPGELALLVETEDAVRLAELLNASRLLATKETGARGAPRRAPLQLAVRVANRERRVGVYPDELSPDGERLLVLVSELRERHGWQRFRPPAVAVDVFVENMGGAFDAERPEEERRRALAGLIVDSLDAQRGAEWMAGALERLAAIPGLGTRLENRHVDRLLTLLGMREGVDSVSRGIVRALAVSGRPEAQPLLLDFVMGRNSVHRRELLALVFENSSDEQVVSGLKDDRADVRAAATASLQRGSLGGDAVNAAFAKLEDESADVRSAAVEALGRLGAEESRSHVMELAAQPGELRIPAINALGHLGGKEVLPVVMSAYASDNPRLRVAAIEAFAECAEPEGISAIVFAMSGDPSSLVQEVAASAIRRVGSRNAAEALRRLAIDPAQPPGPRARAVTSFAKLRGKDSADDLARLVHDEAVLVGDAAALALAEWRDPESVERLLDMLSKGRSTARAQRALEVLSLETFAQDDPLMVAALYEGWWELAGDRGPRAWLVDALRLDGFDDPILDDWLEGRAGREAVPALVHGLSSEKWAVRRACDLALRELTGRSVGEQEPWTTTAAAARMAAAWKRVWGEMTGGR